MTGDVLIRPYAPADAQALHDLNMEWLTAYFQVEPKDEATLSDPEGTVLARGGQIFLADWEGQTVGCVALLPIPDGFEVAKMAVTPAVQGRGVGRQLLGYAIEWARAQGARRL